MDVSTLSYVGIRSSNLDDGRTYGTRFLGGALIDVQRNRPARTIVTRGAVR